MITIMTPTYNRAYILPKAYNSLKNQTSFEFEWIIVDDGSTDNTEEVVKTWLKEENPFKIIYKKQENGGKHRAVNKGVLLASYDYFLILDSDDYLTDSAVETIHKWIKEIDNLENFAGVSGLRGKNGNAIGGSISKEYVDVTNAERKKFGLLGDKAEVYKTKILKEYPFPEFVGENFLKESASWDRIAKDGYKIRWFNEIIYICDYIEDGLTKNTNEGTLVKNFQGFTYCVKLYIETRKGVMLLNQIGFFYKVANLKGLTKKESAKLLNISVFKLNLGILIFKTRQFIKKFIKR